MNLYRYNTKLKSIPCGSVTLENSYKELERILSRGGEVFNDGTTAIPATSFTLAKSDKDFLEISCHSVDEVHFASERLIYNIPFFKKPFASSALQFRADSIISKRILANYFELSREEFEKQYSAGYADRRSMFYYPIKG